MPLRALPPGPWNIAHRGARSLAPENTLVAAAIAHARGAHLWELDVTLTRDGAPVVFHDDTLTRTTDVATRPEFADRAPWRVADFTLAELRTLDAGSWFAARDPFGQVAAGLVAPETLAGFAGLRVPTLAEALAFTRDRAWGVNLELKDQGGRPGEEALVGGVVGLVGEFGLADRVLLSSFQHRYLAEAKRVAPRLALGVLVEGPAPADPVALVQGLGAQAYHPRWPRVSRAEIARLGAAGIAVNAWTLNGEAEWQRALAAGVAGVFTDFPQRLAPLLKSRQEGRLPPRD